MTALAPRIARGALAAADTTRTARRSPLSQLTSGMRSVVASSAAIRCAISPASAPFEPAGASTARASRSGHSRASARAKPASAAERGPRDAAR
jgi:hypothetical protein